MSTHKETTEYILEMLGSGSTFSVRAMFGEYALYCDGVVVGLICGDQLYIKDVPESSELADYCDMGFPFSKAKEHYVIEEHHYTQIENLSEILENIAISIQKKAKAKKVTTNKRTSTTVVTTKSKSFMEKTFSERVVELALLVPYGRVTTYGALARAAGGGAMSSQSITGILGKAYANGETGIPFHRIVYSDGRIWTSAEYDTKRRALYKKEGIEIDEKNRIVNFKEKLFEF
jgi:DNA transformation protein and related proteins